MKNNLKPILKSFIITAIACIGFLILHLDYVKLPANVKFFTISVFILLALLILVGGVISIIMLLISRIRKKIPRKINIVFAISITTIVIFCVVLYFVYPSIQPLPAGSNLKKFDSKIWKLESSTAWEGGISEREKMLKDLVKNILPGKSNGEIIQLLGEPLDTPYFQSIDKDMIYYLGPQRNSYFNIDSEWLLIWLDDSGYFKKYRITND